jgi:hypothetical protein
MSRPNLRGGPARVYTESEPPRHASLVMSERYAHLSGTDL